MRKERFLITGGCGFIGCNVAQRLCALGHKVTVLDSLARPGSEKNLALLQQADQCEFVRGDVRDREGMASIIGEGNYDAVIHLAAQVAVTTSVQQPYFDFEVNAMGTLNTLEAIRAHSKHTVFLNASTNKVYGKYESPLKELDLRYDLMELPQGVSESQPLDFHSPYGLFERCGRPVCNRLRSHLRPQDGVSPTILHLRLSAVWR